MASKIHAPEVGGVTKIDLKAASEKLKTVLRQPVNCVS